MGALLYPVGLWTAWQQRHERQRMAALLLIILIPPTYLLLFANINYPHDYYQLIITPFLAIVSAVGLGWLATRWFSSVRNPSARAVILFAGVGALLTSAALTYLVWLRYPDLNQTTMRFEELCAGKFKRWSQGMVFVDKSHARGLPNYDLPEMLYAAKLWGYAKTVANQSDAQAEFERFAPAFPKLQYVVFYGISCPDWLPRGTFQLTLQDEPHRLCVFERVSP